LFRWNLLHQGIFGLEIETPKIKANSINKNLQEDISCGAKFFSFLLLGFFFSSIELELRASQLLSRCCTT
jgi:hypothetical protein